MSLDACANGGADLLQLWDAYKVEQTTKAFTQLIRRTSVTMKQISSHASLTLEVRAREDVNEIKDDVSSLFKLADEKQSQEEVVENGWESDEESCDTEKKDFDDAEMDVEDASSKSRLWY